MSERPVGVAGGAVVQIATGSRSGRTGTPPRAVRHWWLARGAGPQPFRRHGRAVPGRRLAGRGLPLEPQPALATATAHLPLSLRPATTCRPGGPTWCQGNTSSRAMRSQLLSIAHLAAATGDGRSQGCHAGHTKPKQTSRPAKNTCLLFYTPREVGGEIRAKEELRMQREASAHLPDHCRTQDPPRKAGRSAWCAAPCTGTDRVR